MSAIQKIDEIPTTRIRILLTLALISATVLTWLFHACTSVTVAGACTGWEPSANMLIFLASLAGVDVAQYLSKGIMSKVTTPVTNPDYTAPIETQNSEASTDVSELNSNKG
jgi:hypothetical protein